MIVTIENIYKNALTSKEVLISTPMVLPCMYLKNLFNTGRIYLNGNKHTWECHTIVKDTSSFQSKCSSPKKKKEKEDRN